MNERLAWIIGIVAAVVIGGGLYLARNRLNPPEPAAAPPVEEEAAPTEPQIQHPVPEQEASAPEPLPPLGESDAPVREGLNGVLGPETVTQWLVSDGVVRRFVATVDNLPRKKVAATVRPLKAVPGTFAVAGEDESLTLDEKNYARYAPLVKALGGVDTKQLAATYLRYYPLMQESYQGLGYPSGYFNDRMVEVIDHLLATPDVQGPVRLTQPHVLYEFADPRLEALSAGQKALIRIGPQNARVIKEKLRALRTEITRKGVQPGTPAPAPATPPASATPPATSAPPAKADEEPRQDAESRL